MSKRDKASVPEPSTLPPNPSVGELRTEIDRARHDAAHTMTALTKKLDVPAIRRPTTMAATLGTYVRRLGTPLTAWIAAAVVLTIWWRRARRRRMTG